jgi:hypothetical protein
MDEESTITSATPVEDAAARRERRERRMPPSAPGYIRGDAAAGLYLGFLDVQGRTFRDWAGEMKIPYAMIRNVAHYKIADLDKAWDRAAKLTKLSRP